MNNFSDFLDLKKFKIEELEAALRWQPPAQTEEPKENEEISVGLLHSIFVSGVKTLTKYNQAPVDPSPEKEGNELNITLLDMLNQQVVDNRSLEFLWPELLRIQLKQFGILSDKHDSLFASVTYETIFKLTYDDKIELLTVFV